jgi:L-asparaginase
MARKRVLIIHTGGTLGMAQPSSQRLDLAPRAHLQRLLSRVPELSEIADVELVAPWNLDSSDAGPWHWQQLATMIADLALPGGSGPGYDGVVVIHGTDTMAYAASALSWMLRGLDRPVIFTGSQRPLEAWRTDARANLTAAVECATLALPEVVIVFGDRILRGCRASKVDASDYIAFDSPNEAPLGRIGVTLDIDWPRIRKPQQTFALQTELGSGVLALTVFPGFDPQLLDSLGDSTKALILCAFGAGNVPILGTASLLPAIGRLSARGVQVVVTTQCLRGETQLELYAAGRALLAAGAFGAGDMTLEAATTKVMWALGHPAQSLAQWLQTDLAGELAH